MIYLLILKLLFFTIENNSSNNKEIVISLKEVKNAFKKNDTIFFNKIREYNFVTIKQKNRVLIKDINSSLISINNNFFTKKKCLCNTEFSFVYKEERTEINVFNIETDTSFDTILYRIPKKSYLNFDSKCKFKGLNDR